MPVAERKETKRARRAPATPARLVQRNHEVSSAAVGSALCATILLHLALVIFAPTRFFTPQPLPERSERPLQLQVEILAPDEPVEQFSYTNPDVPSNPPDESRYFASRDQQAGQIEETEVGDPHTADITGEEPEPTQNLVEGQQQLTPVELQELMEALVEAIVELPQMRPIPGFDPVEDPVGTGPAVSPEPEVLREEEITIGVPVEGLQVEPVPERMAERSGEERVTPRPRPVLPQYSRDPVGRRVGAAPVVGHVSIDARFREFGDYTERMLDVIRRQWHMLAWETLRSSETGTLVALSFQIDSQGMIHGMEVHHSTASLTATLICQDAITSRQPYGPWTQDMREVLGDEQTVSIRFHYR
jgi:hypothetical protein